MTGDDLLIQVHRWQNVYHFIIRYDQDTITPCSETWYLRAKPQNRLTGQQIMCAAQPYAARHLRGEGWGYIHRNDEEDVVYPLLRDPPFRRFLWLNFTK